MQLIKALDKIGIIDLDLLSESKYKTSWIFHLLDDNS